MNHNKEGICITSVSNIHKTHAKYLDMFTFDNSQTEEWLANEEESLDKLPSGIEDAMFVCCFIYVKF